LIALPSLESIAAPLAKAAAPAAGAKNLVSIGAYLGWHQNAFFPKEVGSGYTLPPTLEPLADHQEDFTVFSGLDHRAPNGHNAWSNFLCGNTPKAYSMDQIVADQIGQKSRFPSVQLTAGTGEGSKNMSFTKQGIGLPMTQRPSVFYKELFMSESDKARMEYMLRSGKSSLDLVLEDAMRLQSWKSISTPCALLKNGWSVRSHKSTTPFLLPITNYPIRTLSHPISSWRPRC
jgi:hypothetical protein